LKENNSFGNPGGRQRNCRSLVTRKKTTCRPLVSVPLRRKCQRGDPTVKIKKRRNQSRGGSYAGGSPSPLKKASNGRAENGKVPSVDLKALNKQLFLGKGGGKKSTIKKIGT